ncbi:MAG: alpha/beta fold hydrolase [Candidatus Hydrogenedentes bacterium]|nr:alpha/beta fold hydrolase [Candidatus Hydrogenedentota bacterium]
MLLVAAILPLILFVIYLIPGVLFYIGQGRILFQTSRVMDRDPGEQGWDFEDIVLEVAGEKTHGWYVPLEDARYTVLFSHGNAGNLAGRVESIGLLRRMGFSVLAYDYGGYGHSTGRPSELRCYEDIRAMWDHLTREKGIAPGQIILFGRSLGAGVTCQLATEVRPAATVLESAFLSTTDVARGIFPMNWYPLEWLVRHRFANKRKVVSIHGPVLIVHSREDEVIPYRHGERLFQLAKPPKMFLEIQGGHNQGFVESMEVYTHGWKQFLAEHVVRG